MIRKAEEILIFLLVVLGLWTASLQAARIITVDDDLLADFNNIQEEINDANNGDIIEVQPGRYTGPGNRDIDLSGKAITVRSTNPYDPCVVATTIIDCNGTESDPHRGFDLSSSWRDCVLDGLTITNGYGPNEYSPFFGRTVSVGGAICMYYSDAIIRNCLIVDNSAGLGSGIWPVYGSPVITNCLIKNNIAEFGGGIFSDVGDKNINNCSFA